MDLYFLGTGAGMPTTRRNVSSLVLRLQEERGTFWMFDCGEGTQHQVLRSPLKLGKCEFIFITHLHGDHLYGLPGLLSSRAYQGGVDPLTVFGPAGLSEFMETAFRVSDTHLPYALHIQEIEPGLIWSDDSFRVTALPLDHRVPSYGYRVEELARPGKLRIEVLEQMGIPPGPLYGKLKRGEDVTLPDGRRIAAAAVLGEPIPGKVVAILGDTRPCENAVRLAEGADVLVHEATFMEDKRGNAHEYGHSTAADAAAIAMKADAGKLVLNHFSSRYKEEETLAHLLAEARAIFPSTVLADDLLAVPIAMEPDNSR
ncbi:ribonuclease Z [Paenibacillus thiaminolyticus]|uniref:ribonuclease Z n=1 Tax=Paenibacillus thiaminolyticus TaxID=49283 RepID=UPI00232FA460|nr:ribonuclease Z [Paenibacillus thiaminolyticus]WCF06089.1 ribonuclease Z [Paenibacillus thiaminolyticus]